MSLSDDQLLYNVVDLFRTQLKVQYMERKSLLLYSRLPMVKKVTETLAMWN